ncbi:MAG: SPFH domain-containing protein [Clostridia bacterium]|nr:SPFH domain-containing protein [Clostridia bacterium]
MGLIRAGVGALGGVLADQWKEFFYCDAIAKDVMVVKGQKRITGRSANTKGNDNIISNGSGIAVADGQCMIIVEQGKIVEVCAEPGEFTYDTSTEPSIFTGRLGDSIKQTFKTIGKRFTYGGDTAKDQRVYYFNTKELTDNKFGTPNPVPFRVVDRNIGLDIDISVRCNGIFSYRIADPLLFYTNVCGNVESEYNRSEIDAQLKTEFLNALQPAFAKISEMGIRYSALPGHTMELSDAMNDVLTAKWTDLRGLAIVSVGINSITAPKEDEDLIKTLQRNAVMRDPTMAGATLVGAQAEAMKAAASNSAGAMTGFMGLGFAQNAGGMNAQNLFAMGGQQQQAQQPVQQPVQQAAPADSWKCSCGNIATGKFCTECGKAKPEAQGWTCKCGAVNLGKFCPNCGAQKPADAPLYRCDKCGWMPEDPHHPPKFCPECGDVFDENDAR